MISGQTEARDSLRQSMASVHTWSGLVPGWLLYLVFLFGTAAFFQQEISAWMRPELRGVSVSRQALEVAGARLAAEGQGAESWHLSFPHPRGGDALGLAWPPKADGGDWTTIDLDPATGQPTKARATEGGSFLFKFHYNFHYIPYWLGRYAIVIASLAMLVAIFSGVVTHKKIFADFFMLRFGKGQRSWLDAHNVTSVLALPFHLMITYTGLVIFAYMLMPWTATASFPSEDAYFDAAYPHMHAGPASGRPASVMPVADLAARAEAAWGHPAASIEIQNPGDVAAVAELQPPRDRLGANAVPIRLSALTGAHLNGTRAASGPEVSRDVMVQLHAGWFAAPVLRWLYFVAGISGTVMIASGLVLWTVKRRAKLPDPARPHFGFRLVERLNIGFIAGATGGIAVYFLANRLLPLDLAHRANWEIHSLFIAWGAMFVWSLGRPAKRAWIETLAAGALLYAAVPAVSAVTTGRGLTPSLLAGDWVFVGFDLTMLVIAALLALAARRMARHEPKIVARRASRSPVEAVG